MNSKFLFFFILLFVISCKPNSGLEDQLKNQTGAPGNDSSLAPISSLLNLKETTLPSQDIYYGDFGGIHITKDSDGSLAIVGLFKITDVVNGSYRYVIYYWQQVYNTWILRELKNSPTRFYTYSYNYGERNFIRIVKTPTNAFIYYLDQNRNLRSIDASTKVETNYNRNCKVIDAKVNPNNNTPTVACLDFNYITTSITLVNHNGTTQSLPVAGDYQWTDSNVELSYLNNNPVVLFKGTESIYRTNYLVALYLGRTYQIANGVDREGSINAEIRNGLLTTCTRDFSNTRYILVVDFSIERKTRYDVQTRYKNDNPYSCRSHKEGRYHLQFNSYYSYSKYLEITDRSTDRIEITKNFQLSEILSIHSFDNLLYFAGVDTTNRRVRLVYEE